jgi:hypothetical protein
VTSRDVFLDSLKTESGMLTRRTDLRRQWSFVKTITLGQKALNWRTGQLKVRGHGEMNDGAFARQAIYIRQQAEHEGRGVLDEFIELANCKDSDLLSYAQTWGCWGYVNIICRIYMHDRTNSYACLRAATYWLNQATKSASHCGGNPWKFGVSLHSRLGHSCISRRAFSMENLEILTTGH